MGKLIRLKTNPDSSVKLTRKGGFISLVVIEILSFIQKILILYILRSICIWTYLLVLVLKMSKQEKIKP